MLYLLQMFGFSTVVVRKYFFGRCDPQGADGGEGSARGAFGSWNFADAGACNALMRATRDTCGEP